MPMNESPWLNVEDVTVDQNGEDAIHVYWSMFTLSATLHANKKFLLLSIISY